MLIEFSGGDGSGKTTAMQTFLAQLEGCGLRVLHTREVGSPHIPICVELRKLILNPEVEMDGRSMELVFSAMRLENQRFYDAARQDYDHIVSDRGWLCHLAYTDHNVSPEFTWELYLNLVMQHTYMPDRVYLFDVDPDRARERRGLRGEPEDAIEAKGHEFQKAVVQSYRRYANQFSDLIDIRVVDANQDIEKVSQIMRREAADLLDSYAPVK
jgi:dTMP kinase